jgi:hypothetical protein
MQRIHKFIVFYFVFFSVLTAIALIPGGSTIVMLITTMVLPLFGLPGLLVIASPTILLYSAALIPLAIALTAAPRRRMEFIAMAVLIAAAVAMLPGLLSENLATTFAARMSADDISRSVATKPRSIELIGDRTSGMFVDRQMVGDKSAACNEICRRLMFNGEADWVRMTATPDIDTNRPGTKARRVTYRIEHRDSCPELAPEGSEIEKAVRDRVVAGDCLIAEQGGDAIPDAVVKFVTRFDNQAARGAGGPASIKTVKDLHIETREDGKLSQVRRQTETIADTLARPFYIGAELGGGSGLTSRPTVGRQTTVMKPIDLAQALRDTFGYKLAKVSPPWSTDAPKVAERVLALPTGTSSTFSNQQQDVLNDTLTAIARQPMPSDADIEFVGRVIADKRVTSGKVGTTIQQMLRRPPARFERLIPVALERMASPISGKIDQPFRAALGWSVMDFSADSLRPYRDKMVSVVENDSGGLSNGVLARLAELGSKDAVDLVVRRLGSDRARQFAAIAACRANAEAWPTLESAVLAHLTPRKRNYLEDDESPLLLALVRFGKKSQALDLIQKRGLFDPAHVTRRLGGIEPGFGPEHCNDWL